MGILTWLKSRVKGITSAPRDVVERGPRAAVAERVDKVWGDTKSAVHSAGEDVKVLR